MTRPWWRPNEPDALSASLPLKGAELDVPSFTAHNIRLDDGALTKPEAGETIDRHPWFLAAKRILDASCRAFVDADALRSTAR
jgi:hypothetical protein